MQPVALGSLRGMLPKNEINNTKVVFQKTIRRDGMQRQQHETKGLGAIYMEGGRSKR